MRQSSIVAHSNLATLRSMQQSLEYQERICLSTSRSKMLKVAIALIDAIMTDIYEHDLMGSGRVRI